MIEKNDALQFFIICFPMACLLFHNMFLDTMLVKNDKKMNYFRCPRASKDFNIQLVYQNNKYNVYNKFGKINELNHMNLLSNNENLVKDIINLHFTARRSINIRILDKILVIYSKNSVGDDLYNLDQEVKTCDDLLNANIVKNPINKEMFDTLVYLIVMGYLDKKLCLLYRNSFLIVSDDGRATLFDINLEDFLEEKISKGQNCLLFYFWTRGMDIWYRKNHIYNKKIQSRSLKTFRDLFKYYLNYDRTRKIEDLVFEQKYHEIPKHIKKEEFDRVTAIIKEHDLKKNLFALS
ncbi:uncharacterized protein VNE69_01119 [Vairimorpha necatrix]|uniref:LAGLIDADG homing endonuclease n=1 Tax=Vairimorpha necatrix TaxID=6039 RepID=A0AAX4J8C0_9MICR